MAPNARCLILILILLHGGSSDEGTLLVTEMYLYNLGNLVVQEGVMSVVYSDLAKSWISQ